MRFHVRVTMAAHSSPPPVATVAAACRHPATQVWCGGASSPGWVLSSGGRVWRWVRRWCRQWQWQWQSKACCGLPKGTGTQPPSISTSIVKDKVHSSAHLPDCVPIPCDALFQQCCFWPWLSFRCCCGDVVSCTHVHVFLRSPRKQTSSGLLPRASSGRPSTSSSTVWDVDERTDAKFAGDVRAVFHRYCGFSHAHGEQAARTHCCDTLLRRTYSHAGLQTCTHTPACVESDTRCCASHSSWYG